jgi:hypothetical protein
VFSTYAATLALLNSAAETKSTTKTTTADDQHHHHHHHPTSHVLLAGAAAGVSAAVVLTPVELIKCRVQVGSRSTFECIAHTARTEGLVGFTRGGTSALAREVPGMAAYFAVYDYARRCFASSSSSSSAQQQQQHPPWYVTPLSGAAAGLAYTVAFYPADVVKTLAQTDAVYARLSLSAALRRLYMLSGWRGMYCGVGISAARQMPANAAIFSVMSALTSS